MSQVIFTVTTACGICTIGAVVMCPFEDCSWGAGGQVAQRWCSRNWACCDGSLGAAGAAASRRSSGVEVGRGVHPNSLEPAEFCATYGASFPWSK